MARAEGVSRVIDGVERLWCGRGLLWRRGDWNRLEMGLGECTMSGTTFH